MVAPTFRKPTNTTAGTATQFGVPDIVYAFNVLDGTHATDRVQVQNIEGFNRLPAPDWVVRKNPTTSTTIEIINTKTGLVQFSGTELYALFNSLTASSDFVDGHNITIKAEATTYNAGESVATFTKDVNIFGYGATIIGGTTAHSSGGAIKQGTNNKSIAVYGLTIDASQDGTSATKRLGTLIGGGSTASSITCKLCLVRDCTFKNVYSYGVNVAAVNNGTGNDPADSTLIIDNCRFDAGTTDSLNEFVLTNALRFVRISNCAFYGNKTGYISAQTVNVSNCLFDNTGFTEGEGLGIHARDCDVVSLVGTGGGLTLRPFTAVHWGTNYQAGRRHNVRGYTNKRVTTSYNAIEITGYDATYSMGEVNLEDIWIGTGSAATAILNQPPAHSKILALTLRNVYIDAFDTSNCIVNIVDHSLDYLSIENVKTPAWVSDNAPLRVNADQSTCAVDYAKIQDIEPVPPANIATVGATGSFTCTVTMDSPLRGGQNGKREIGTAVTGNKVLRFLNNWGKATLSGDGSTTAFNIAHNLLNTPNLNRVQANAANSASNGAFHVSGNATNVIITYQAAPASGTNNLSIFWYAAAGP